MSAAAVEGNVPMASQARRSAVLLEEFRRRAAAAGVAVDDVSTLLLGVEVALLAVTLARIDRVVLEQERRAVEAVLAKHFGLSPDASRLLAELAFGLGADELPGEEELLGCVASDGLLDRLVLLDSLCAVAAVDRSLDWREERFLDRLAERLNIGDAAYQEILRKWDLRRGESTVAIPLGDQPVTIGRDTTSIVQLPGLSISAQHAVLVPSGDGWELRDLGSASGTWVNGARVRTHRVAHGDRIRIENFFLRVDLAERVLLLWDQSTFTLLSAERLSFEIEARRQILRDVSCSFCTGELVAFVGPSGCGKTTLLGLLLGSMPATGGHILLNGEPCPDLARRYTSQLGIVPQDDIVYALLTVEESLFFSGCLRSVPGVHAAEISSAVDRVVDHLELARIRDAQIGDPVRRGISGGERKRVNLGQELLSTSTRFLVLDEPTTGLDPHTSLEIFRLLRRLTDEGRLVLVVTHQVDDETLSLLDKLLVLGANGKLVYFGPPADALSLLQVDSVVDLYSRLKDPDQADRLAERYQQSSVREHATRLSRILATEPAKSDGGDAPPRESAAVPVPSPSDGAETRTLLARFLTFGRQVSVLTRRYFRVKVRDTTGILVGLGQVPLIVFGCWLVLRTTLESFSRAESKVELIVPAALPFVLVVCSYWLGCANAVREIVTDQAILRRERLAGLGLGAYVLSKLAVLVTFTAVQCGLLIGTAELLFGLSARHVDLPASMLVLGLVGSCGVALALCVSASCRSAEAAVVVLPFLVIPQLLFGGLLVPFDRMPERVRWISYAMATRWGMDGMIQSASSGIAGEPPAASRELATIFAIPGVDTVARNWFLKMLGLATLNSSGSVATPEWSYCQAVAALACLVVVASIGIGVVLRVRRA